ncbi:MAG: hypothetical protein IEMM0006_0603 [bacterium]|nr:MAG: hypothetical protein IEMM0006_0603 [bacterium]
MKGKELEIVFFTEIQNVKHFWIRLVLLFEIIVFSGIIYRQLFMGKPFGAYPVTDNGLIILSLLLIIPIAVLFFIKVKITVGREEVCYKMLPMGLFQYRIARQQLKSFSIETKDIGKNNETSGLKLILKNEKSLFLPSKKPKQMFQAVQKMMNGK